VAVANGVVYFQSMLDGTLYALDAKTGAELAQVKTGGQSSGPAISRGQIYLSTGDAAFPYLNPTEPLGPGSVVALGLNGPREAPGRLPVPFLTTATGTITGTVTTAEGVLTTFVTQGQASPLGSYTSAGFDIVQGSTLSGRETFTAADGDQFVMTFTGTVQSDGSVCGTFTLGVGTGRFAGIGGDGEFLLDPDPDGVHFDLDLSGYMLLPRHHGRAPGSARRAIESRRLGRPAVPSLYTQSTDWLALWNPR
jgi:hypothetical protein